MNYTFYSPFANTNTRTKRNGNGNCKTRSNTNQSFPNFLNKIADDILNINLDIPTPNNSRGNVNIIETDTSFDIEVAFPGASKADFKVNLEKETLTISAETTKATDNSTANKTAEEKTEAEAKTTPTKKYIRREFNYRSFKRSFQVPENINVDGINAKYEAGILTVSLPKVAVEEVPETKKTINIS